MTDQNPPSAQPDARATRHRADTVEALDDPMAVVCALLAIEARLQQIAETLAGISEAIDLR